MIIDLLKQILIDYRNSISMDQLEEIFIEKKINVQFKDTVSRSDYFHVSNNIVFLKSELLKTKSQLLVEIDDFLQTKAISEQLKKSLLDLLQYYIPEIFFSEWINIPLERKLIIFDLLFNLIIKQKNNRNKIKKYFNQLVEFYSIVIVYSLLLVKNFEDDLEKMFIYISEIEPYEELLKKQFYNILCYPDIIRLKYDSWHKEFENIENKIETIIQNSFLNAAYYSKKLLKRVIEEELKKFESLLLFSRYEARSFYEWLLFLTDQYQDEYPGDLFQ